MFKQRKYGRLAAGVLAMSLVVAACGDDGDSASDTTAKTDSEGAADANSLIGMRGTTPMVDLGDEFKARLMEIDPKLVDFNYAGESYDAAIIIGLAVTQAKTDGSAFAEKINGITRGGEKCTTFEACKKIIDAGGDPDYDGQSGPLEFSGNGEPTEASYGVLELRHQLRQAQRNSQEGRPGCAQGVHRRRHHRVCEGFGAQGCRRGRGSRCW